MKRFLTLFVAISLAGCENTPAIQPESTQNRTSVMFVHNVENEILFDCSVGYYIDSEYNKIADLGDMVTGEYSDEIELPDETISEICLFTRYPSPKAFAVCKNEKNLFVLSEKDIAEMAAQKTDVTIGEGGYNVSAARYEIVYSKIFDEDIVRLYIDLTGNGGIIVEMSKQLLGQQIALEPNGRFWFFSIGNGVSRFQSFENKYKDFEGYAGWFKVEASEQTSDCSLEFEFTKNGEPFAVGAINRTFERV